MKSATLQGSHLSLQQERLWSLPQSSQSYRIQCAIAIDGHMYMCALMQALTHIVQRHEILRSVFRYLPGMEVPMQVVTDQQEAFCIQIDVDMLDVFSRTTLIDELFTSIEITPFDVTNEPPLRGYVVHISELEHLLFISLPALCVDTDSFKYLVSELGRTYAAILEGQEPEAEPLQYIDVSAWQNEMLQEDEAKPHRERWRGIDLSQLSSLHLPFEQTVALEDEFSPQILAHSLDESLNARLQNFVKRYQVTSQAFMLSCWLVLLRKLLEKEKFVAGVSHDGRSYEELGGAIGLYSRYLPLLADFEEDLSFEQVLLQTDKSLIELAEEHLYFTWEEDASRGSPLTFFSISFAAEQWPEQIEAGDVQMRMQRRSGWQEPFVLQLSMVEMGERLRLELHYDRSRLFSHLVQGWLAGLQRLVEQAITMPEVSVSQLPVVSQQEEQWQQEQGEGEQLEGTMPPCFHELFEQQVRQWPDAPALCDEQERWSYAQLNAQANRLARALRAQGVGAGELVGVCLSRGGAMIVSLLGVLKAGGAYVPLEPEQPAERLRTVLEQTQMRVLLTEQEVAKHLPLPDGWAGRLACLEEVAWSQYGEENLPLSGDGEALAAVIYTSGSTGMPKGVMLRHRNLLSYTQGLLHRVQGQVGWRYATVSTLGADLGNSAIFGALGSGGCLHVVSYATLTQAQRFAELMQQERIDVLKIVPSHLSSLLAGVPMEQRGALLPRERLIVGGERFSVGLREQLREIGPNCEVYNHYGPTETTVGVLMSRVDLWAQEQEEVPLGRPLARSWVAVLDRWGERVPRGVVGELYVGGGGVSAGYLGAQEQTQARFVPVKQRAGERVYRTGDRVRMRQDGQLVFVGRVDRQIKLRGYRIELGEIEAQLSRHPQVREAVVVLREEQGREARLVGYLVGRQRPEPAVEEIAASLRERVPEYMLPAVLMWIRVLPLTSNGKIEYHQLPAPTSTLHASEETRTELATPSEEVLQGLWQDLLKREQVGVQDNFFQLGGHSLLATQLIARLRGLLGVEVPLLTLFEAPTLEAFARRIDALRREQHGMELPPLLPVSRQHPLPLSFAQQRLWFLEQLTPGTSVYNKPAAMWFSGQLQVRALQRSLHEIVRRHEILRTTFHEQEGQAVQVIGASSTFDRGYWDLRGLEQKEQEQEVSRLVQQEAQRPFDLERGPLLRVGMLSVRPDEHLLLLTMHHIVSDGWSNAVFMNEVTTLYRAFVAGQPSPLPALSVHYADYAAWQRSWLQGTLLERQLSYWREQLRGVTPAVLPDAQLSSTAASFSGASYTFNFSADLSEAIVALSRQEGVTLFMTLLAAFQTLLYCHTHQRDIVVGTDIANRTTLETEGLIGFFVNLLVLRTDLSGRPTFRELLSRVREMVLNAYMHQDTPFELLVDALLSGRTQDPMLLVRILFVMQNTPKSRFTLPNLTLHPYRNEVATSKFDLALFMSEKSAGLGGSLVYNVDLFTATTIERFVKRFETLLNSVVSQPDTTIDTLEFQSAAEKTNQAAEEDRIIAANREGLRISKGQRRGRK